MAAKAALLLVLCIACSALASDENARLRVRVDQNTITAAQMRVGTTYTAEVTLVMNITGVPPQANVAVGS